MKIQEVIVGKETKYEIQICAVQCGRDWSVTVCGGTKHHIGAVAIGCGSQPSGHPLQYSATVSNFTVLDHKDHFVAQKLAGMFADALHATVSVSVGIHIDDATPEELKILQANSQEAAEELLSRMVYTG